MKDLRPLPRFDDRWSHLYLERGRLEKKASSLSFYDKEGEVRVPIDRLAVVLLGPGTSITHAAMKLLADNNCLLCWVGESGVRLYSHNTGGTHSARKVLHQAAMFVDEKRRMEVVKRMFKKRFTGFFMDGASIEELRGMEGARVRAAYQLHAEKHGMEWSGRSYRQENWNDADPVNRALSAANACMYGICHAAILSASTKPKRWSRSLSRWLHRKSTMSNGRRGMLAARGSKRNVS